MKDHVFAIGGVSRAAVVGAPREGQKTPSSARRPQTTYCFPLPQKLPKFPLLFPLLCQTEKKEREQRRGKRRPAAQQQEKSIRRDGYADLIGDGEITTSFETFFGEKYLDVTE